MDVGNRPGFAGWMGMGAFFMASAALVAGRSRRLRLSVVHGIEFVSDHDLEQRRLEQLACHVGSVEREMQELLGVPRVEPTIRIYLFAKHADFSDYVREHIPTVGCRETSTRRGLFLLRRGRPYVFVVAGERLVTSLRHETVHVVLNSSHPHLPLWVDEGLAQCFESPDRQGSSHAERILENDALRSVMLDSKPLESLRVMAQVGPREYASCWARIHELLRNDTGRDSLRNYLAALREGRTPPSLSERLPDIVRRIPQA